jgi:signal-transduction protein with cAMP-binding, CBS, and nucleotidyltransferase domain
MPDRAVKKIPTLPELADAVKNDVRQLVSFLDSGEMVQLFTLLQQVVAEESAWGQGLGHRREEYAVRIRETADYQELRAIHDELNGVELEQFIKIQSVPALHRNCTEYRDQLAGRVLQLVAEELDAAGQPLPDLPYALISMGSDGREEQTLITDQDYLIVYGDGGGEAADASFKAFATLLVERLETVGFKKCTGDIMPSNPTWRGSYSQWRKKLLAIVRYEYEDYAKNLMDLIVLSDARFVAGDQVLANDLIELIRDLEREFFQVLYGMAKAACEMTLALGFLKRIWTEGSGDHKGEFNLKLLAWAPLVMNVRILAINQGIPASSTVRRIELLQQEGSFSASMAQGLIEAYQILTKHRILLQIRVIKGIQKDSYYLNPYALPPDEREQIRQALLRIEELQKVIHTNFHIM